MPGTSDLRAAPPTRRLVLAGLVACSAAGRLAAAPARAVVEAMRGSDGLFRVGALVDGTPVRLLVDTGASVVVLTAADAARARVRTGEPARMDTAGGRSPMRWADVSRFDIGTGAAIPLRVAVVDTGMPTSLLGLDALLGLGRVEIDERRLRILPR